VAIYPGHHRFYLYRERAIRSGGVAIYKEYYAGHAFTHVTNKDIDLKQIINTNKCFVQVKKHDNKIFIISIMDNLLKGASGQAVQNMNLMFGLDERAGLRLKAIGF
jgi:N-acetyl-gamma-glutamyl-phosphate reductase